MNCYHCGHYLISIDHGGCGGSGGISGCEKCDAVYRFEGGGICSAAHPVLDRYSSFADVRYRKAKEIKPYHLNSDFYKENSSEHYNKWMWREIGGWEVFYTDTKEEAEEQIKAYVKRLHDALPWPVCDKCGRKPDVKFGLGSSYKCIACDRTFYGNKWYDAKTGE